MTKETKKQYEYIDNGSWPDGVKMTEPTFEHMMIACMFTFLMQLNVQFLGTAIRNQRSKDRWSKWDGSQNPLSYNKTV